MNRKTTRFRTLRASSAHKHLQGPAAMKRGLFSASAARRALGARPALALPATLAFLLLYSCDPPASQLPASPNSAAAEVIRISGLPNMEQIEQRLKDQYAESAGSTEGVEFTPSISGTTVSASITYAEGKLLPIQVGGTEHRIKTITITRDVDGKTIPTTVEYKDKDDTTRKTVTSRYVPPPKNVAANNARQSLEGGAQFAEAEGEGGPALHISGEEKDGANNILRRFTATEEIQEGKTILRTTYRRSDNEGLTETLTTENGIPTQKVVTYPDKQAAAKNIKTKTITYEKSAAAMFYPARQKLKLTLYEDAEGKETKRDEPQADGSIRTTMPDKSTITTTTKDKVTLAVHKDKDGNKTKSIETTRPAGGGTLVVHKDAEDTETLRVETRSDKSTITTKGTTKELVIHSSVTAIEDSAFYEKDLTSLTIGNGVKTIGRRAFYGNKLTSLTIGNRVQVIRENAFTNNRLTSLTIPPSVTWIREAAFANNRLTSVSIGNGVQTIGNTAFRANQLTSLSIGNSVQTIGDNAFADNKLTSLTIPPSVFAIGKQAFYRNNLTSLTIGNGVQTIESGAFANNRLTSLKIGNNVQTIGEQAFANNDLTSVSIPPSVNIMGRQAFLANKLDEVRLSKKLYDERGDAFKTNPSPKFRSHKGEYYY